MEGKVSIPFLQFQSAPEETMQANASKTMWQIPSLGKWPWWIIVLLSGGLILLYLILADTNYRETFFYLTQGLQTTLRITFFSYIIATVIGLFVGLARTSKNPFLYHLATLYVETVRGVPLMVLILYIAFALVPFLVDILTSMGYAVDIRSISMEWRGIIALALGYGAFEAEIFRAGIQSIGKGQMEAAKSLGMNYFQAMRFIILPQAIRRVLPPLGNDFIACLKDSSLITVLAVNELTQMGRLRRAATFRAMETFNVVAFLYLSMTLVLSLFVRWLEHRLKIEE
jgi:His/Glu/Gln/Arg/opine family amino acid ABC transporter permease subunit